MALTNFGHNLGGNSISEVIAPPLRKCDFQLEIRTEYADIGNLEDLPMRGFTIPQYGLSFKPTSEMMQFSTSSVLMNECMFELYVATDSVSKILKLIKRQYKGGMLNIAYKRPKLVIKVDKQSVVSAGSSAGLLFSKLSNPFIGFPASAIVNAVSSAGGFLEDSMAKLDQASNLLREPTFYNDTIDNSIVWSPIVMELNRCILDAYSIENDSSSYDFSTIKFVANYLSVTESPWIENY